MKTLCVYATRTGHSKKIAEEIAEKLGAELLCVTDGKDYRGAWGYLVAAVVGLRKKLPALLPYQTEMPLKEYDRVITVTPIWCENLCPTVRAFLLENREELCGEWIPVVTHMSGLPYDEPARRLSQALGKPFAAFLSLQTKNHNWCPEVEEFLGGLEK